MQRLCITIPSSLKTRYGHLVLALLAFAIGACSSPQPKHADEHGLEKTACWFGDGEDLPPHTCYYMNVDETAGQESGRTIAFPVIFFESTSAIKRSPLLHLGAGGPGASLALDLDFNIWGIYQEMRSLSLEQGRDLYLIDPRGAGQAKPLLMCQEFVDNVITRWQQNMTLRASYDSSYVDFDLCIDNLNLEGLNLASFSSEAVVQDLEQLRLARDVDQWVLYGASYASVYAQLYARDYPEHIESMILDSATFLDTPRHEVLVRELTEPYRKLFDYCTVIDSCSEKNTPTTTEQRFWSLIKSLDQKPVLVKIRHPAKREMLTVVLTGWRFLDSMLWGVYGEELFTDFPVILNDLENGQSETVRPYVEGLIYFLLDDSFGDISASAHYCIDSKPYIDEDKITEQIETIPFAYARSIARLGMEYDDDCDDMGIAAVNGVLDQPIVTDVPTLFIHGTLDSVTLLDHVTDRLKHYSRGQIVTSSQAHIVLDDPCVLAAAAQFLQADPQTEFSKHCAP